MKNRIFVSGCLATLLAFAYTAKAGGNASWIGVWQGELDGQPAVTLTLAEDPGELGGTVVFNMVSREDGTPHVIASEQHVLMHPHVDGRTLSFQVKRIRDSQQMQIEVKLGDDGKARLHCLNCGSDSPTAELVKVQPQSMRP